MHFPRFALDPSAEPPASWASGSPPEMTALRNVMHGSRIRMVVKSEAPIVRTNSPYRVENRVTLFDVDIEEALFSRQIGMLATTPAKFDELLTLCRSSRRHPTRTHHEAIRTRAGQPSPCAHQAPTPPDTRSSRHALEPDGR